MRALDYVHSGCDRPAVPHNDRDVVSHNDRDLVMRFLRSRSDDAFRSLYRQYSPQLRAVVLRLTQGDAALTDEVLQDSWFAAVKALDRFRWESSLSTWLTGIAVNNLRAHWRRGARLPTAADALEYEADSTAVTTGDHMDLERAVAGLPRRYRSVVVLYGMYGYTHAEIGRMLDISEGASKSRLSRARQTLRRLLRGRDNVVPRAWSCHSRSQHGTTYRSPTAARRVPA
jgi:RNA polymerase sigma factor (sigma-70 family)